MTSQPSRLQAIRTLVKADLALFDTEIERRLSSDITLINQLGRHIIGSGGKRLRPLIVLLSARTLGYEGERHIQLATVVEFIHTATLLHDDVVDGSKLRRGQATANTLWGNEASVLVGDFLYSRAFEMMVEVGDMRAMEIMAETTNTIAEGEVMQLLNCRNPDVTEEQYIKVIRSKTAKLFEAAARLGAVLAHHPRSVEDAMGAYGLHLGVAFQLIDDMLDYEAKSSVFGKNVGDDLAEGKATLPLIHALRVGVEQQRTLLRKAIEEGDVANIEPVIRAIESSGSIAYTSAQADLEAQHARQALSVIPDSLHKQALLDLAHFSVHRDH
ncbi:MAG: octaprenyl diphosphate synthase [Acidiferrobacteraceae bacterium]